MKFLTVEPFQETHLHQSLCAPGTLKMLLLYWDLPGQEKTDLELAEICGTDPDLGTSNEAFLKTITQFGLESAVKSDASFNDIQEWLDKGVPVVVDWFSPGPKEDVEEEMPDGHYSIVVGLDDDNVYLQDPEIGRMRTVSRKQFYRVWFDFTTDWIEHKDNMVLRWMAAVYPKGSSENKLPISSPYFAIFAFFSIAHLSSWLCHASRCAQSKNAKLIEIWSRIWATYFRTSPKGRRFN